MHKVCVVIQVRMGGKYVTLGEAANFIPKLRELADFTSLCIKESSFTPTAFAIRVGCLDIGWNSHLCDIGNDLQPPIIPPDYETQITYAQLEIACWQAELEAQQELCPPPYSQHPQLPLWSERAETMPPTLDARRSEGGEGGDNHVSGSGAGAGTDAGGSVGRDARAETNVHDETRRCSTSGGSHPIPDVHRRAGTSCSTPPGLVMYPQKESVSSISRIQYPPPSYSP
ncbi:hypothetical protein AX17_006342 [Amanita inopinata Kibby_2008]|nr:hypothetical protein AX17_006342 [Amanita inopinata Kibby_2008]